MGNPATTSEEMQLNRQRVERRMRLAYPLLALVGAETDGTIDDIRQWLRYQTGSTKAGLWLEIDDIGQMGLDTVQIFDVVVHALSVKPSGITSPGGLRKWLDELRDMVEGM